MNKLKAELARPARPVPPALAEEYVDLDRLETEALRRELGESLHVTAAHLRRLATIVRLLEERGEDLSDLRIGLLPYLRQIAHGQVLPEVVVRFAESPWLVRLIGALPLPDQARLAAGERIPLAVRREDTFETRLADPLSMTRDQVLLAFCRDRIRSQDEQILMLEDRGRAVAKTRPRPAGMVVADRRTGTIRVGKTAVPLDDVLAAVAELRTATDDEADEDRPQPVMVRLSEEEHARFKTLAAQRGLPMTVLARRAMRGAGLI